MSNITGLSHLRFPHPEHNLSPFGGLTVGYDLQPGEDGNIILYVAVALCANSDNYNRKVGRQIVEGRIRLKQTEDVTSDKKRSTAVRVSVNVLDNAFFDGKQISLKQTSKGVYYIPKEEFNLHDIVLNSVIQDFVRAHAQGHPYGPFFRGRIERTGGFTLLVVDIDREAALQYQQAMQAARDGASNETMH